MPPRLTRLIAVSALVFVTAAWSPFARAGQVTIDATQVVRTVDDRVFGLNTAVWDGTFPGADNVPLLQAIDIRALRFPGGSLSDEYHWKTNTTLANPWTWSYNFDTFAAAAVALKTQVFITINYGTGTVQEATDWVTYSNVTKGYGFKYWEIGNENYGTWETDAHAVKNDPYTYANDVKQYIAAMKAVDPTIKVGIVVNTGEDSNVNNTSHPATNPRTGQIHNGWTPVLLATLKTLGVTPDFAVYHRYDGAPGQENDATLLQKAKTWPDDAANLRQMFTDYLGSNGANVELLVTENNSVYGNPGKQSTSLVNGLYMADSVGNVLQTEFNSLLWWDLRNGQDTKQNNSASLYGWRNYGDYGILSDKNDPYPTYYTMKLLSHFARGGDQVLKTTSNEDLLSAFAVRRTNGTLTLLLVNKAPVATDTVSVSVTGFNVGPNGKQYSYGIPQDEAARTSTGSPDIATADLSGLNGNFQVQVGPYTETVLELQSAPPSAPTQSTAYASSATEVVLTWQPPTTNGASVANYKIDRATDSAFTLNLSSTTLGAVLSYTDTGLTPGTTYYYRLVASNLGGASAATSTLTVATPASNGSGSSSLVNIAARAYCAPGNSVTIGGFVISGSGKKRVLVRAVGPTLAALGIGAGEVLADPVLELHSGNQVIAQNDNWGDNSNATAITSVAHDIGATALQNDTKSAALLIDLDPGPYTFVVHGANNTSGVVLLEVYDADTANTAARFVNIATRGFSNTGNGVAIGGFVISGNAPKNVLVRAMGPTLATLGLSTSDVLSDPMVELHQGSSVIARNDNWADNGNAASITATAKRIGATALAGSDSKSAVLLMKLMPGAYTFIASGQAGGTGVVLVEVYDAD